ncbi:MAG: hypothetical protein DRI74_09685 [Bacteroidetes bacterium]|nr:MAG: hypothetical protein DRI74_09685 [Bacteroidota bacterium]
MEGVNRSESDFSPFLTGSAFLILIVYWMVSFYHIYWKSRWWKYVRQSTDKYDERELKSVSEAMRKAYSVFVIVVGVILLIYSVLEWSLNGLFVAFILYFAHILPASILKWQGYEI